MGERPIDLMTAKELNEPLENVMAKVMAFLKEDEEGEEVKDRYPQPAPPGKVSTIVTTSVTS